MLLVSPTIATRSWALATQALLHPSWAVSHLSNFTEAMYDRKHPQQWAPVETLSVVEALEEAGGWQQAEIRAVLDELVAPTGPESTTFTGHQDGSSEFIQLANAVCRLAKPQLVLETGVAHGFSTASILQALERNGSGHLISIDLPHLHPDAIKTIGAAVPKELRSRWTLCLGGEASTIPRALATWPESLDLFVQDASHSFRGQLKAYGAAWPFLRDGGVLLSDDVSEPFDVFARQVGRTPIYIRQPKWRPVGLIVK
jgi:predicted O-methyltransferase YrrM